MASRNKHAEPCEQKDEREKRRPPAGTSRLTRGSVCSEVKGLTDQKDEVLVSLREYAHYCAHHVVVVVALLVALQGLKEQSGFLFSDCFLHIGQKGSGDVPLRRAT